MSLLARLKGKGKSGFGYGSTAEEVTAGIDLQGKNFLVTGCNSGLGLETARVLALRGAHVLGAARTREKAQGIAGALQGGTYSPYACELSDPTSVRACVSEVGKAGQPLQGIICNAGIMALPTLHRAHGYELQFFTNHIGHFMLVTGLLDQLADGGRVVVVASEAHRSAPRAGIEFDNLSGDRGYEGWTAYGQSKIANILFAKELARRLDRGRTANALHPGVIQTNLARSMSPIVRGMITLTEPIAMKSVAQGAATQCYVATHPSLATVTGEYFQDCNLRRPRATAEDPQLAARLWEASERIVAQLPT